LRALGPEGPKVTISAVPTRRLVNGSVERQRGCQTRSLNDVSA